MINVEWMSEDIKEPCLLMERDVTPVGGCFTFNRLPKEQIFGPIHSHLNYWPHEIRTNKTEEAVWSPDRGYKNKSNFENRPWRTAGRSYDQDVSFHLFLNSEDFDKSCHSRNNGFWVTVHNPAELATQWHPMTFVSTDQLSEIKVIPEIKKTKEELRKWDPKARGCYFEDERPLLFFNYYTEKNCYMECQSNTSLSRCGCVPFYLPRYRDDPMCGPAKQNCYKQVIDDITKFVDPETSKCDCLPSCFETEYKISVTKLPKQFSSASVKANTYRDSVFSEEESGFRNNFAEFTIQYQTHQVTALMRVATFRFIDFLANIGGLLGFFLGFSVLSLFEIIYFFIIRVYNKKRTNRGDGQYELQGAAPQ
uniref:Pickpocket protein 28 n=1 Tax=Graphocephala atropunctata TaxID=36148 RepID=A0A1B6M6K4_9HEMI